MQKNLKITHFKNVAIINVETVKPIIIVIIKRIVSCSEIGNENLITNKLVSELLGLFVLVYKNTVYFGFS